MLIFFFYKNLLSFFFSLRYSTLKVPLIHKLVMYFPVRFVDDLNDVRVYNYVYFFKFFFGLNAFISKQRFFFFNNKWIFTFNVLICLNDFKIICSVLFYCLNDILPFLRSFDWNFKANVGFLNCYCFFVSDLNMFSERKTNLGLFNLSDDLCILVYLNNNMFFSSECLKCLKFDLL